MASVHDVASMVVQHGPVTAMKLQKICYYAQAWSLAWGRGALFAEPVEAWINGPVIVDLWREHRGARRVDHTCGDPSVLTEQQRDTVERVLGFYMHRDPEWLSELTHREGPWLNARDGLSETDRASREITLDSMRSYYGAIADEFGEGILPDAYERGCELLLDLPPHEVPHFAETVEAAHADVADWLTNGGEPPWPHTSPTGAASS